MPNGVTERCGCSQVGDAYAEFLDVKGSFHKLADDGNCISEQLAKEDGAHRALEDRLIGLWQSKQDNLIRQSLVGTQRDAEIDLVSATNGVAVPVTPGSPTPLDVTQDITYSKNTLAGGLLFGGGHDPTDDPVKDSEFGNDTRTLTGTIKLRRVDNGSDPTTLEVEETVTFNYVTRDALDFCPGNTSRFADTNFELKKIEYNQLLADLSRLEASGMARDVGFEVKYHRTTRLTRRLSQPSPTPPPAPTPPAPTPPAPTPPGRVGKGLLTSPRFMGPDGQPDPTLEACREDRARLTVGARGDAVAKVQQALVDLGFDLGATGGNGNGVDAVYGQKTAAAVRAFKKQQRLGSEQFGDVGPGTMGALDELFRDG